MRVLDLEAFFEGRKPAFMIRRGFLDGDKIRNAISKVYPNFSARVVDNSVIYFRNNMVERSYETLKEKEGETYALGMVLGYPETAVRAYCDNSRACTEMVKFHGIHYYTLPENVEKELTYLELRHGILREPPKKMGLFH